MANILSSFNRWFRRSSPIPPGIYHYQAPPDDPRNYRLHLRVEPDGSGILIINAATVLHLNQTATDYAYYMIKNLPAEEVARKMSARYQVRKDQALEDYLSLSERIQVLINTPDLDPVSFLDLERQTPFTGYISAPYRLDCAITYRLPQSVAPETAPVERVKQELTTEQWKTILDKAWQVGIPHIVFTGGEPTLRDDLPDLIAHAEANNQVSGLLSDGLRLVDKVYLNTLLQTGLDHLLLLYQPNQELFWTALENTLVEDLFVAVHFTITQENTDRIPSLLEEITRRGVKAVSLSTDDVILKDALHKARDKVANLDLELIWNLPVSYSSQHPVALETEAGEIPEGAGRAWLYVEPDGDVLPSQGINQVLGNMLKDPWEKIWKK